MTINLLTQAVFKILSGFVLLGLSIFLSAGTFCFFNGWLLMCVLFVPIILAGLVMMFKNPELLRKRLNMKEKQTGQKLVIICSVFMFVLGFIIAGLGFRFDWYILPRSVSICCAVLFVASYILYAELLRENPYLDRTVKIQDNQKVIETGLYSMVRHPMYSTTLIMFLLMPLILGSLYSFLIFMSYPFIIVKRIKGEEELLEKELDGYCEYKQKVKYRIIPFVF